MAKITSKADLVVGTNLIVNEPDKTIQLLEAGGLSFKNGVTWQALYSKLVDLWATASYQDSPFPVYAIDALSGQFQIGTDGATYSGWTFTDDTTRSALRDGGWSEFDSAGNMTQQFCGFIGLGSVNLGAQPYYHLSPTDAATNFAFQDQFNVGIKVYGDSVNGNFDKRSYAKTFIREYGKKFKSSILADTGATATGANKQNFLISNEDDLKIISLLGADKATADALMSTAPYSGITVAYYTLDQQRNIGGMNYPFNIIIEGNGGTLEQIYAKVQYLLRQSININVSGTAGTKLGNIQNELLNFVGDTLGTATGVYIDDVLAADSNRVEFYDTTSIKRTNPYTAAGTLNFNAPLVGPSSSYRLLFKAPPGAGNDFGESDAITVNDASGIPITGTILTTSIAFTYDYDGNTQGGATPGTDRDVVFVGIKPGTGKYVAAEGVLTRSKGISLSLVAEQDRVYSAA